MAPTIRRLTDPDAIEPGEPNPAHTPMRMDSVKRTPKGSTASSSALKAGEENRHERSNLFPSSALQHRSDGGELGDPSKADGVIPSVLSVNDLTPQNWRTHMTGSKPEDFAAELAALRHDVTKLTSSVSDFLRTQTAATTNTVFDAVDNARQRFQLRRAMRKIVWPERAGISKRRSSAILRRRCLSRWLPAYL